MECWSVGVMERWSNATSAADLELGYWSFFGVWSLMFGVFRRVWGHLALYRLSASAQSNDSNGSYVVP